MMPPDIPQPLPNAVMFQTDIDNLLFDPPAILTLEYLEDDVDREMGFMEQGMKINQMVLNSKGDTVWIPVPGEQVVNPRNNTVSVAINTLDTSSAAKDYRISILAGSVGLFGNLPGATIEENAINIRSAGRGAARLAAGPVLQPGSNGIYTSHYLEFPGYTLCEPTDSGAIRVTIRQAVLLERITLAAGTSFPQNSGAVFVITTKMASGGAPVAFTSPVNFKVQFMDGSQNAFNDILDFDGQPGKMQNMAVVFDSLPGMGADFHYLEGVSQSVISATGGGLVTVTGAAPITDGAGIGTWGVVSGPDKPMKLWMVY